MSFTWMRASAEGGSRLVDEYDLSAPISEHHASNRSGAQTGHFDNTHPFQRTHSSLLSFVLINPAIILPSRLKFMGCYIGDAHVHTGLPNKTLLSLEQ